MGRWRWVEHGLEVGDVLQGFCGGYFGRDALGDTKVVEGVGKDWVVVREPGYWERVFIAFGDPSRLEQYLRDRR